MTGAKVKDHTFTIGDVVPQDATVRVKCTRCGEHVAMHGTELRGCVTCQKCSTILGVFDEQGRRVS